MCCFFMGSKAWSGFCASTGGVRDASARSVFSGERRPRPHIGYGIFFFLLFETVAVLRNRSVCR